jgi:PAS domain S-box-containing protein
MSSMQQIPDEAQNLRRCVRDLVALSTLPAIWGNADSPTIGRSLAAVLLHLLSVDFIYVRLDGRAGGSPAEAVRTRPRTETAARAHAIGQALEPWLRSDNTDPPPAIPSPLGEGTVHLAVYPIGHAHNYGLLAAGCGRLDFPTDTERLLLSVAVNQAADLLQRKEAEEALRKQTEWLRVTLASIGDAVITLDAQGLITSLNPIAESLTGWKQQEAQGQPLEAVFRILHGPSRQPIEDPAARVLREGLVVGLGNHTILIARDGTERPIDDSAAPIHGAAGEIIGVVLIFRDVAEQRQAEAELRRSEAQFRQLADALPQIVWTARPDGYLDYYNERWYEYTGFPRGEYGDASWKPILHPDDVQHCVDTYYGCIQSGNVYQIEYRFKDRHTGGYRWFLGRAYPVRDDHGRIVRWFGTCTDIDDTKRAEEIIRFLADASATLAELTDYESTLQRVVSLAVPRFADWCAVDMQQADGSVRRLAVTHTNSAKVELAHELFRRYPPHPSDPCGVMNVLRTGKPEWVEYISDARLADLARDDEHLRLMRKLGLKSYICVPLQSRTKPLGGLTFVMADSGRVYDAEDLRAALDLANRAVIAIENASLLAALRESDQRKDEFLAMLAHELRNPLAPIRNAVHVLHTEGAPVPELQWARAVIDRQAQQLTRLVDDLLDVSRITRGKIELRKERVQLATIINSAVEASRPLIEKGHHELTVTLPPEPIFLDADATRLAQVLLNLLNNAAKYTEPGGHIGLSAEREGQQVILRVQDTGIGIAREMVPRIFDLFVQVDRSLERAQGGLGIGLTLVQRLVQLHGGSVEAHSDGPGKGSAFTIRLPVVSVPKPGAPARQGNRAASKTPMRRRILVVDDNRDAANSLAMLLKLMGHEVATAHDGLQALETIQTFQPHVALLDLGMPKLNGYDAARRIRELWNKDRIVLIALTGWGQEEDRRRTREAGFDHHLVKPVDVEALQQLLARVQVG